MTEQAKIGGRPTGNIYIDTLIDGGVWVHQEGETTSLTYAIRTGHESDGFHSWGNPWSETETAMLKSAFAAWESVANVKFIETDPESADIWYWKGPDQPFSGIHDFPAYSLNTPNAAIFCDNDRPWLEGLNPGGIGYVTLIHEIGHGLGLTHPHDYGNDPEGTVFPGVESSNDYGDYDLNQSVYTIMSYNDGLKDNVNWSDLAHGFAMTPMAFDIAAIQHLYGANMNTRTGDDTYSLPVNTGSDAPLGWSCIWDAGGNDTIDANYVDGVGAVIDLRAAPLVGEHAGGYISRIGAEGGGFIIANGVVIENAVGSWSDDLINGNDADNVLHGLSGNDVMFGMRGADTLYGYDGDDTLDGGAGDDQIWAAEGSDVIDTGSGDNYVEAGDGNDTVATGDGADIVSAEAGSDSVELGGGDDLCTGGEGDDVIGAGGGNDAVIGDAGDDSITAGAGDDGVNGGVGNDSISGEDGDDILIGDDTAGIASFEQINERSNGLGGDDLLAGGAGEDSLYGMEGDDTLLGGDGADMLNGGAGRDTLTGGGGSDRFEFDVALNRNNADMIIGFEAGFDVIAIDQARVPKLGTGALAAKSFWAGPHAHNAKDFVIFDKVTGDLWYDPDGRAHLPAQLICTVDLPSMTGMVSASDFIIV